MDVSDSNFNPIFKWNSAENLIILVCTALVHVTLTCAGEKSTCIPSLGFMLATCILLVNKISATNVSGKNKIVFKFLILYIIAHFLYGRIECFLSEVLKRDGSTEELPSALLIFDQLCVFYFVLVVGYECYNYVYQ